jgi:hypothetical protein
MDMTINATGQDQLTGGIDDLICGPEIIPQRGDATVPNPYLAREDI